MGPPELTPAGRQAAERLSGFQVPVGTRQASFRACRVLSGQSLTRKREPMHSLSKNASTISALSMVLIALATVVGGGATTWHYWNTEQRAVQSAQQAAWQRHLDWWKGEMHRANARRLRLDEAQKSTPPSAFVTAIPTSQEQAVTQCPAASIDLETPTRPQPAVFRVPSSGRVDR
jgi:hypothetical protein